MLALVIAGVCFYSIHATRQLFDVGVNAHTGCAIHSDSANPLPQSDLADSVAKKVTAADPSAQLVTKGICSTGGRDYTEVVIQHGTYRTSIALTARAESEVFPRALAGKEIDSVHFGDRRGYAVGAFEQGQWLGYIVSNMPDDQLENFSSRLVPLVRRSIPQ